MAEYFLDEPIVKLAAVYYPKLMDIVVETEPTSNSKMKSGRQASCKVAFSEATWWLGGTLSNLGYEIYGDVVPSLIRNDVQLSGHTRRTHPATIDMDRFDGTACQSFPNIPPISTSR